MPLREEAFQRYGDEVRFLGVVSRDDAALAAEFLSDTDVTYPSVVDTDGALLDHELRRSADADPPPPG